MKIRRFLKTPAALFLFFASSFSIARAASTADYAPNRVIVRYKSVSAAQSASLPAIAMRIRTLAPTNNDAAAIVSAQAQAVQNLVDSLRVIELNPNESVENAMATLRLDPNVAYAEPDYIAHAFAVPNDTYFAPKLWSLQNTGQPDGDSAGGDFPPVNGTPGVDIKAVPAWDIITGGPGVIVATIDSGIDYTHTDLAPNMWNYVGPAHFSGDPAYCDNAIHGCDFANQDNNPMDDFGHGTHVAGIIGARGNNNNGVTGVAWNVQLMALKFLNTSGTGNVSDAITAIQYAVRHNAAVINNSWGTSGDDQSLHDAIIAARQAGLGGTIITAAAGNSGDGTVFYPGAYPEVICVASTNNKDHPASTSSFGPHVDVAAPGDYIWSTLPNQSYGWMHGTSMATPVVSGIAALIRATDPLHRLTVDQITTAIVNGVDVPAGWDNTKYGSGRVNLLKALQNIPDTTPPTATITSPTGGSTVSGTVSVSVNASDNVGVAKVEFRVDGTLKATITGGNPFVFSWDSTTATNGSHNIEARAYDLAGNQSLPAPFINLIVANADITPPTITIDNPHSGDTVSGDVIIRTTPSDNVGVVKVDFIIDNVTQTTLTNGPWQFTWHTGAISDGPHTITVKAYDAANNTGSATLSVTSANNDKIPPTITITAPKDGDALTGDVTISATASDNVGVTKVDFIIDNVTQTTLTAAPYQFVWHSGSASDGPHTIAVKAYDLANNTGSASINVTTSNGTSGDTTPPTVTITAPQDKSTVSNTVTITAQATDNIGVAKVEFVVDGNVKSTQTSGSSPYQFAWDSGGIAGNGPHSITVNAYDANNNKGSATISVTVANGAPDTTPPTVSISSPKSGDTVSKTVTIIANAADNVGVSRVEFRVDGAILSIATTPPYQASGDSTLISNGPHTIEARAYDAANNNASASITVNVLNDLTPPTVSITSPSNGAQLIGNVTIAATAADDVGVIRVDFLVDGSAIGSVATAPYHLRWNASTAGVGLHTLVARAFDASGKSGEQSISIEVLPPPAETSVVDVANSFFPLRGETLTLTVNLSHDAHVKATIVNPYGEEVQKVADDSLLAGPHSYSWDGRNGGSVVAAGMYVVLWEIDGSLTKKKVVVRK